MNKIYTVTLFFLRNIVTLRCSITSCRGSTEDRDDGGNNEESQTHGNAHLPPWMLN